MFDNLSLRSTILATAAAPIGVLTLVALWSAMSGRIAVAAICAAGAGLTAFIAAQQVGRLTSRVGAVAEAARRLTDHELPALAHGSSHPGRPTSANGDDDLDVDAATTERSSTSFLWPDDELTAVMEAITGITPAVSGLLDHDRSAIDGRVRRIVEALARRTEALLNEQIASIDLLEDTEQQPDRLQQLYRLDHLTNRARRSTESVLVLAEAVPDRPRREPSPIDTVIRVAIGETNAYARIKLATIDPAWVEADASFDLAHLLAELLENATNHSSAPDAADVEVFAVKLATGDYRITVVDHGPGMAEVELASANVLLADPPPFSLEQGSTIGLIVMARLADRLGAIVDLTATPGGGVTAIVTVPDTALVAAPGAAEASVPDRANGNRRRATVESTEGTAPSGDDGFGDTPTEADHAVGLRRRHKPAGSKPLDLGPRLAAADHDPAAVQAVISRYRDGLGGDAAGAGHGGKDRR